jgi:hypothetical protein
MIISRRILLWMKNVSDKSCIENETTHSEFSNILFLENRAVCEVMWKNIVQPGRPRMTIRRMRIACWITNATDTHSEYVMLLAFLLQQRLHEHSPILHYSLRACLISLCCRFIRIPAQQFLKSFCPFFCANRNVEKWMDCHKIWYCKISQRTVASFQLWFNLI